ncbi:MAG: sulfite exporter TauE/SafE family protein [Elusimicrobia bacterium]|nr:sulfite exporter TauE/SafE family protein [Elusimicrobiota bacterium]
MPYQLINLSTFFTEGFALGLSTGAYCLGACAPLLVPYMLGEGKSTWKANGFILMEFMAGRLLAYILFAVIVSFIGIHFSNFISPRLIRLAMGLSGLLMIIYAMGRNFSQPTLCRRALNSPALTRFPLILGFSIGINICPPFAAGMTRLIEMGSILFGIFYFLSFFTGTSLYVLPLILVTPWLKYERLVSAGRLCSFFSGIWFLVQSLR